jgi:hypothetical protein
MKLFNFVYLYSTPNINIGSFSSRASLWGEGTGKAA